MFLFYLGEGSILQYWKTRRKFSRNYIFGTDCKQYQLTLASGLAYSGSAEKFSSDKRVIIKLHIMFLTLSLNSIH